MMIFRLPESNQCKMMNAMHTKANEWSFRFGLIQKTKAQRENRNRKKNKTNARRPIVLKREN